MVVVELYTGVMKRYINYSFEQFKFDDHTVSILMVRMGGRV